MAKKERYDFDSNELTSSKSKKKSFEPAYKKSVDKVKLGSKEFAKLQSYWYGRLSNQGFDDIEWSGGTQGLGHNTPYLKRAAKKVKVSRETAFYFEVMCNFSQFYEGKLDRRLRFILEHHKQAMSYRNILKRYNKQYKTKISLYALFCRIRKLKNMAFAWNLKSEHGIRLAT